MTWRSVIGAPSVWAMDTAGGKAASANFDPSRGTRIFLNITTSQGLIEKLERHSRK